MRLRERASSAGIGHMTRNQCHFEACCLGHAFANLYTPVAIPVIMNRYDRIDKDMLGKIDPRSRMYEEYN